MNIILCFIITDLISCGVAALQGSSEISLLKTAGVKSQRAQVQSEKAIPTDWKLEEGSCCFFVIQIHLIKGLFLYAPS